MSRNLQDLLTEIKQVNNTKHLTLKDDIFLGTYKGSVEPRSQKIIENPNSLRSAFQLAIEAQKAENRKHNGDCDQQSYTSSIAFEIAKKWNI